MKILINDNNSRYHLATKTEAGYEAAQMIDIRWDAPEMALIEAIKGGRKCNGQVYNVGYWEITDAQADALRVLIDAAKAAKAAKRTANLADIAAYEAHKARVDQMLATGVA